MSLVLHKIPIVAAETLVQGVQGNSEYLQEKAVFCHTRGHFVC